MAGLNGQETLNWVKAAGMLDFDTFYSRCKYALTQEKEFIWPGDLPSIDYGFTDRDRHGPIMKP